MAAMQKPPVKQPAADAGADTDPMNTGADAGADDAAGAEEDDGADGTVLLTVMKMPDGTYKLMKGDEPEDDAEPPAADAGAEGADAGQTYDSPGALLKGILDIIREDESTGGEGSAEDQLKAGYDSGDSSSPMAPAAKT